MSLEYYSRLSVLRVTTDSPKERISNQAPSKQLTLIKQFLTISPKQLL